MIIPTRGREFLKSVMVVRGDLLLKNYVKG